MGKSWASHIPAPPSEGLAFPNQLHFIAQVGISLLGSQRIIQMDPFGKSPLLNPAAGGATY